MSLAAAMTSENVVAKLTPIAKTESVAVLLDLDALPGALIDRSMMHVLEALLYSRVHVAIVPPRDSRPMLHVAGATYLAPEGAVNALRARDPDMRVLAIGTDSRLVSGLHEDDRVVALRAPTSGTRADIVVPGAISLRSMLWWLVDVRKRESRVDG